MIATREPLGVAVPEFELARQLSDRAQRRQQVPPASNQLRIQCRSMHFLHAGTAILEHQLKLGYGCCRLCATLEAALVASPRQNYGPARGRSHAEGILKRSSDHLKATGSRGASCACPWHGREDACAKSRLKSPPQAVTLPPHPAPERARARPPRPFWGKIRFSMPFLSVPPRFFE
jgi:hypothetical protein